MFREVIAEVETEEGDVQEVVLEQETRAIAFDATDTDRTAVASDIKKALEALPLVGGGNVVVNPDGDGFLVEYMGGLGFLDVAELSIGDDVINVSGIDTRTSVKGGGGPLHRVSGAGEPGPEPYG